MKALFSTLIIALLSVAAVSAQHDHDHEGHEGHDHATTTQKVVQNPDGPVMDFEAKEVDYGVIEQDSDPYRFFNFTNTGKEPLIITYAKGSCGCTVPEYSKEPIMPGENSQIKVRYDTKRIGRFTKTVTLTTNEGGANTVLRIKGEVKPKAAVPTGAPEKEENPFK